MKANFLIDNWEIIAGSFTSVVAYFGGRRAKKMDALSTMQKSYNEWVEDQKKMYSDLKTEFAALKIDFHECKKKLENK